MGKGDQKSKRGKIVNGSYGVRRPHKKNVKSTVAAVVAEKPAKTKVEKKSKTEDKPKVKATKKTEE